jgi:hypothetical protein
LGDALGDAAGDALTFRNGWLALFKGSIKRFTFGTKIELLE